MGQALHDPPYYPPAKATYQCTNDDVTRVMYPQVNPSVGHDGSPHEDQADPSNLTSQAEPQKSCHAKRSCRMPGCKAIQATAVMVYQMNHSFQCRFMRWPQSGKKGFHKGSHDLVRNEDGNCHTEQRPPSVAFLFFKRYENQVQVEW